MREPAVGLLDDFGAGAVEVRLPVGRIVVLIGIEIAVRVLHVDLADHADGAVGAFVRVAEDRFGAVGFQDALALSAGVAGQHQFHLVAAIGADHGVRDAGIAAGGIENRPVVIQLARAFAIQHHIEGRPVLDAAAGIEILGLAEDLDARKFGLDLFQAQQRRIADGREQRLGLGARQVRNRESVGHSHLIRFRCEAGRMRISYAPGIKGIRQPSELSLLYSSPQSLSRKGDSGQALPCRS